MRYVLLRDAFGLHQLLFYVPELGFQVLENSASMEFVKLHLAKKPLKFKLLLLERQLHSLKVRVHRD